MVVWESAWVGVNKIKKKKFKDVLQVSSSGTTGEIFREFSLVN